MKNSELLKRAKKAHGLSNCVSFFSSPFGDKIITFSKYKTDDDDYAIVETVVQNDVLISVMVYRQVDCWIEV